MLEEAVPALPEEVVEDQMVESQELPVSTGLGGDEESKSQEGEEVIEAPSLPVNETRREAHEDAAPADFVLPNEVTVNIGEISRDRLT